MLCIDSLVASLQLRHGIRGHPRTLVNIVKQDLQAGPVQQYDARTKLDRSGHMLGRTLFQTYVVLARRTSFLDKTLLENRGF